MDYAILETEWRSSVDWLDSSYILHTYIYK